MNINSKANIDINEMQQISGLGTNLELLTSPFNSALLAILIANSTEQNYTLPQLDVRFNLYAAFYKMYLNKEFGSQNAFQLRDRMEFYHSILAIEIFKASTKRAVSLRSYLSHLLSNEQLNELERSRQFCCLLNIKKDLVGERLLVQGFFHETLMEFLVANALIKVLVKDDEKYSQDDMLSLNLTFDVNLFFREGIEQLSTEEVGIVFGNLEKAYKRNLCDSGEVLENKQQHTKAQSKATDNTLLSKRRGQIEVAQ